MTHVPVNIRPHLVSFFFKEMEGEEIHYLNKRTKSVVLVFSSTLNKFLRIALSKVDTPVKLDNMRMLLTIEGENDYKGTIYRLESDKKYFLELAKEVNDDINDFLEDFFRIAFVYYILGHSENDSHPSILSAIEKFITTYNLENFGFDAESLRRYYYREIGRGEKVSRISKRRGSFTK